MRTAQPSSSFLRTMHILERIAKAESPVATAEIIRDLSLPKPTAHRIVSMLERAGLVQRDAVSKHLIAGARLHSLAVEVVMHSTQYGPRHQILTQLADATGETATFTMFERGDMLVVDRVESAWPLRVNLFPGSRVPMHCSASGKLMLAMMSEEAQARLLKSMQPLRAFTPNTVTQAKELVTRLSKIRAEGVSTDNEEFMTGLVAVAVPVLHPSNKQMLGALSLNAPAARMNVQSARHHIPALRNAAQALSDHLGGEPPVRASKRVVRVMRRKVS